MSRFSVHLYNRDFSEILRPMELQLQPSRLSWAAIGGPDEAIIDVTGPEVELWELVERLRCPVEIGAPDGQLVWWGYVESVSIRAGNLEVSVSLEQMVNRVCVTYAEVNVAGAVGERMTTSWYQDNDSIATYGTKEKRLSKNQATSDEAINYAQTTLARLKYPIPAHQVGATAQASFSATLTCRGWWQTLGWKYYGNTSGKESYEVSGNDLTAMGDTAARTRLAQSFTVASGTSWQAAAVKLRMKREGSPADNVIVGLYANSGSAPGSLLSSGSIPGTAVSENLNWHEVKLAGRVTLTPGTTYWIVAERSGALNGSNYYRLEANEDLGYANGVMRIWNGSSWVARNPDADMLFQVGGVEENGQQLSRILSTGGQFLTGVDVDIDSGIYSSPYRDGDSSVLQIAEELLESGTSNQRRLLAVIDAQRRARVFEEPAPGTQNYLLHTNGEMYDWLDRRLQKWDWPAGVWVRLANVIPASADIGRIADPSLVFIESVTYNVDTDEAGIRERDAQRLLEY